MMVELLFCGVNRFLVKKINIEQNIERNIKHQVPINICYILLLN